MLRKADARPTGHLDVLGSIPPAYRQAVLEQCERRLVAKGKTLWSQGEPADYVAFLAARRDARASFIDAALAAAGVLEETGRARPRRV